MGLLKEPLSGKVLTIGPDYQNHRGGIGAVLSVYASFFETFNFIPTYKYHNSNLSKIFFYFKQVFRFSKTLRVNKNIEIVHIHGAQKGSFYRKLFLFFIAKNIFRKKVIYHAHSDAFDTYYQKSPGVQKKLLRYFINHVDAVICLAAYWETFFRNNFQCRQIYVINNVIKDPATKASFLLQETPFDKVNFLFLGRLGERKGIFDIMRMLIAKKSSFDGKIKLSAGGDGETERLVNEIDSNKLGNIVEYKGWISGDRKNELFLQSHVYILPSYSEGLPISVLEAMSYGLPVISTPVGGIPEIVHNNINGLLVQPGDLKGIEEAMLYFVNNPCKIKEWGKASLKGMNTYFPEYVAQQLQEVYETLLAS